MKLDQMKMRPVGNGHHRTERRLYPVGKQQHAALRFRRSLSDQPREGGAETARRLVARVDLRLDDAGADGELARGLTHSPLPGEIEKGNAKAALEGAPHGGGIEAAPNEIALGPAMIRTAVEQSQEVFDQRILTGHLLQRSAALARPEAGIDAGGHTVEENAVFPLRLARGT